MSDPDTPNQPLLNHHTAVNVEAQALGGRSSSRAYKVTGLVLLASVLIVGQALTAYFVLSQRNDIKALEKQSNQLKSDMTNGQSGEGAKYGSVSVHIPMNVMPEMMDNTMDVEASTGKPNSDTPLTDCQLEASGTKKTQVPGFQPTCDSNGLYNTEQCMATYCWCVDPVTGIQIPGTLRQGRGVCVNTAMAGKMNLLSLAPSEP